MWHFLWLSVAAAVTAALMLFVIHRLFLWALIAQLRRTRGRPWLRFGQHREWMVAVTLGCLILLTVGAWWATGHPLFGLLLGAALPITFPFVLHLGAGRKILAMDQSALAFLHALQGQVRVGASVPLALMRLSESFDSPFSRALSRSLRRYKDGTTLKNCLQRFREDHPINSSAMLFTLLELSYRRGLSVSPLLGRMIPLLEADLDIGERLRALRASAAVQASGAALMPWTLALVLAGLRESSATLPSVVWLVAVGLESLGTLWVWRASRFA